MADIDRLKMMTAWQSEPQLSEGELRELLMMFGFPDPNLDAGPVAHSQKRLRAAAREGWKWKAAKASELQSTDLDGDRMSANQIFEHCQRMIRTYSGTAAPAITGSGFEEAAEVEDPDVD